MERQRLTVLKQVLAALETLSRKYAWEDAFLFGSLCRPGGFGPESDIDIAVAGLSKLDHYAFVGDISNILDRPVDVVRLEDCPFAQKVVREGIPWKGTIKH
jgi:predicted nucleotidyltransferase